MTFFRPSDFDQRLTKLYFLRFMFLLVGEALTTVEEEIKLDVFLVNIALRLPLNGKEEFNNKLSFLALPGGGARVAQD